MDKAGDIVMNVYSQPIASEIKKDASPVTEADTRAEQWITQALTKLWPECPIVAEEAASAGTIPEVQEYFWLVDPLDGTKEFISRNGEFTVNIALIENGTPVMGAVLAPALRRLYYGAAGLGAFCRDDRGTFPIVCRPTPDEGLTIVASRSHGDADALEHFLAGRKVAALKSAGSSLKLCLVAAGEADIYPRLGRTMEWDIAAGHAVLSAAGGKLTDLHGNLLRYGKPGFENPHFVAQAQ